MTIVQAVLGDHITCKTCELNILKIKGRSINEHLLRVLNLPQTNLTDGMLTFIHSFISLVIYPILHKSEEEKDLPSLS
jgi:hypothetical protein